MDILVNTEWLAENLGSDDLVILDASAHLPTADRDPASEFGKQHIPGARFLDLPSLKDKASDVPAALPRIDQFGQRLRMLGIDTAHRVVLYDHSKLRSSARARFIFKIFGFEKVVLLDGGFEKWLAEERPVETGFSDCSPSNYRPEMDDRTNVRDKAAILSNCETRSEQVVDARDAARFTGQEEDAVHGLSGGHIPGAKNLFFRDLLQADGSFKNADDLQELFAKADLDPTRPITASCGSGMTASVVLFALELLGQRGALYDGSWSEWGADPDTPKEKGPAG